MNCNYLPKFNRLHYDGATMKRLLAGLVLIVTLGVLSAHGQGADDQYVHIYTLIQQGDALDAASQPEQALAKYQEAQTDLERFKRVNPDWNNAIVNFRLSYLAAHIAEIQTRLPAPEPAPTTATNAASTNAVESATTANASRVSELENQLHDLRDQVKKLEADKQMTEAKLKEALSAQPASVDPREFAKAQEKVAQLEKENSLLQVSLDQAKSKAAQVTENKANEEAAQKLATANQKLTEQTARADKLAAANEALQARLQSLTNSPQAIAALQAENELLKKQVARLQAATPATAATDVSGQLADARKQIASLQTENQTLRLEATALQDRVKKLSGSSTAAAAVVPVPATDNSARIKQLEQERDNLQKQLDAANKNLSAQNTGNAATRVEALTSQLNQLRAQLAIYEARAVPYTPEELALFKAPAVAPVAADSNSGKTSIQAMPPETGTLVAEAQRHFAAKQFDKAEADYQQILKRDNKNTYALANLAAIELEENHLDAAQKHITQAVEEAPNDAYNLSILGYLRLKQGKYDDALEALSRGAKLDPQNAEIQNYLGVVLGHKGLRSQAETALRKAIQLNPNYGSAHNNLAVIYVTQKPPLVELARWHYQKALADGQPRNPELEKLLNENKSADTNQ